MGPAVMSMGVWVMMGIAIWHFAVFVPDRFWGGIVGAFLAAIAGAALFGFLVSGLTVPGRNDTEVGFGRFFFSILHERGSGVPRFP